MPVHVVTAGNNPQHLAFWLAQAGAGWEVAVAEEPLGAPAALLGGRGDMAVLPTPLYLRLVAERRPVVVVANLLAGDPVHLVLTRAAAAWGSLAGLRIGVAPGPRARQAPAGAHLVTIPGEEQDAAFREGAVDGLYAHTPHLERAIVDGGGVLAGSSLAEHQSHPPAQVHAMVAARSFVAASPGVVAGMVARVARAQEAIRRADPAALDTLAAIAPAGLGRAHLAVTLQVYGPAMPPSPAVTPSTLRDAARFRPSGTAVAEMSDEELAPYLLTETP